MVAPAVAVEGVGAVVLPVPPVAVVYQSKVLLPVAVAVRGTAVSPTQYCTGAVTGAAGLG